MLLGKGWITSLTSHIKFGEKWLLRLTNPESIIVFFETPCEVHWYKDENKINENVRLCDV